MSGSIFRFCMKHLLVLVIGREASWRADRDYNSHGLVDPLTVITIVALRDHDVNRPLATSSVVPSHLLCAADVVVFEFEPLAWLHLFERIFFVGFDLVDHHSPRCCFGRA